MHLPPGFDLGIWMQSRFTKVPTKAGTLVHVAKSADALRDSGPMIETLRAEGRDGDAELLQESVSSSQLRIYDGGYLVPAVLVLDALLYAAVATVPMPQSEISPVVAYGGLAAVSLVCAGLWTQASYPPQWKYFKRHPADAAGSGVNLTGRMLGGLGSMFPSIGVAAAPLFISFLCACGFLLPMIMPFLLIVQWLRNR